MDGLHAHCNDPGALDMSGMFGKDEDGSVVFIRGKSKGRSLGDVARANRHQHAAGQRTGAVQRGEAAQRGGVVLGGEADDVGVSGEHSDSWLGISD